MLTAIIVGMLHKIWASWTSLTSLQSIMPWQFGQLGLTESKGNRLIKYADALINGVSTILSCCSVSSVTLTEIAFRLRPMTVRF